MTLPRSAYSPQTDPESPAYESVSYGEMMADVKIVQDCYVGTRAINQAGITYLRQFSAESGGDYTARLNSSKFWNAFRRTVHGLVGLIFRKNPVVQDDVPEQIKAHLEDVDLQGTHLDVFAKERCLRGMVDGHAFIYVDMPQPVTAENPQASLADELAAARRPYWVGVDKRQVVNWYASKLDGKMVLAQVTIWERVVERNGRFGESVIDQYLVLEPGRWERWRMDEGNNWYVYAEGVTSLTYIPLVPFYALQTGYMESTPPLLDVAHENLRHYNLQSSLDRVLDLCNVPMPVLIGRSNTDEPLVFGRVLDIPVDGDAKYLEPTGVAIEFTQNEIDRCKQNIASLGLLLLSSQPKVTKTATETTVEYTAETSELSAIARNLQDCLERCLMIHADYLGVDAGGQIAVNKDFVKLGLDAQTIQRMQDDVSNGRLTLESYWKILEQAELLPDNFEAEEEKKALGISPTSAAAIKTLTDAGSSIDGAAIAAGVHPDIASRMAGIGMVTQ